MSLKLLDCIARAKATAIIAKNASFVWPALMYDVMATIVAMPEQVPAKIDAYLDRLAFFLHASFSRVWCFIFCVNRYSLNRMFLAL